MVTKVERVMTERQRYWLGHVRAADASKESTVAYAGKQGLKVKDLYQWKTKLIQLKLYRPSGALIQSSFVPVKAKAASKPAMPVSDTPECSASGATLVFPSGVRFEFDESISPEVIRTVIASTSEPG